MNRLTAFLLSVSLLAGVSTVAGCSSQRYEPSYWHTNFVQILNNTVGRKLGSAKAGGWAPDAAFVSRTDLPSGHIAYKYRYQGTCRYTFEVDSKTDVIVVASWEGEARHCAIVP